MSHPTVKFSREIHLGTSGKDVIGHKRAISRAMPDAYPWRAEFTPYCGDYFIDAILEYKKHHTLGDAAKIGIIAHTALEATHRYNHPDEWAFDALAIELCQQYYDETHVDPETAIRQAIVSAAMFWYHHRYQTAYSMARPFELGKPPWVAKKWDCSAYVTACWYAGGGPDPNGRGYDHEGYTGTLKNHGTRVNSVNDLKPGDLIFYGFSSGKPGFNAGDPTHVALYYGLWEGQHMINSNGSYPMRWTTYNYRSDINHYRHYEVGV